VIFEQVLLEASSETRFTDNRFIGPNFSFSEINNLRTPVLRDSNGQDFLELKDLLVSCWATDYYSQMMLSFQLLPARIHVCTKRLIINFPLILETGNGLLKRKRRMVVLALVSLVFSVFFYAFVDGLLFGAVIPENQAPAYWIPVSAAMFLLTFMITLTPLFWRRNFRQVIFENYFGVVLLVLTPVILVSCGFLDLISASVIEYVRGKGPLNWLNYQSWWWMDPYPIGEWSIPWSIAWLVAFILGHEHTLTVDMLIGSTIGLVLLLFSWTVHTRS